MSENKKVASDVPPRYLFLVRRFRKLIFENVSVCRLFLMVFPRGGNQRIKLDKNCKKSCLTADFANCLIYCFHCSSGIWIKGCVYLIVKNVIR